MEQNRIFERLAAFEGWLHENGRAMGTREKYLRDVRAFADWANGRPLTRELALAMLACASTCASRSAVQLRDSVLLSA